MKDSYSFDIDDEGPGGCPTKRTGTPTSASSIGWVWSTSSSVATAGAMGGSRSEEFLGIATNGEGRVRPLGRRVRRQRRGRHHTGAGNPLTRRMPPRHTSEANPGHPDHRVPGGTPEHTPRPVRSGMDCGGHAQERPGGPADILTARAKPFAVGGSRRSGSRRQAALEAQLSPAEVGGIHRRGLRQTPGSGQGIHRPGRARRIQHHRNSLPRRSARRRWNVLGDRRETSRAPMSWTSSLAVTSRRTGRSKQAEVSPPADLAAGRLRTVGDRAARYRTRAHLPARLEVCCRARAFRCSTPTASG